MVVNKIIKLSSEPENFGETEDKLDPHDFVGGVPTQHTHLNYENEEQGIYVGVWDTNDMVEASTKYPCDEFMYVIDGKVEIRNTQTNKIEIVSQGESFIIPRGYDCQWIQKGYLRKFFFIFESNQFCSESSIQNSAIINLSNLNQVSRTGHNHRLKFVHESPKQVESVYYKNSDKTFVSGKWKSAPFRSYLAPHPVSEFICVTQGQLSLFDEKGIRTLFELGDVFYVPQGAVCYWQAEQPIELNFAFYQTSITRGLENE